MPNRSGLRAVLVAAAVTGAATGLAACGDGPPPKPSGISMHASVVTSGSGDSDTLAMVVSNARATAVALNVYVGDDEGGNPAVRSMTSSVCSTAPQDNRVVVDIPAGESVECRISVPAIDDYDSLTFGIGATSVAVQTPDGLVTDYEVGVD